MILKSILGTFFKKLSGIKQYIDGILRSILSFLFWEIIMAHFTISFENQGFFKKKLQWFPCGCLKSRVIYSKINQTGNEIY